MENTSSAAGAREPVTKQQSIVLMGPLKPYRPQSAWKSTSVGFIPNPTTPRAEFMNSLLHDQNSIKVKIQSLQECQTVC